MTAIQLLEKLGIYYETVFNGKHCYKYQPKKEDVIIVSDENKSLAAEKMLYILKEKGQV